ncbi:hypothetical protein OHA72_41310 [Dactylosporangium sp. NBC_01737]|uniref:hypothetical protein n=1 Tax=Dactylosporangium sp. NBC_01737 TaxID=2975959 RepID=UPI002E13D4C1|nr:hypothetical protein OHA72_41310 [Dactylosporangium sp. NBC_01737]
MAKVVGYVGAALLWLAAAGALVAAAVLARDVGFEVLRHRVEFMIAAVAVLILVTAVPVGPAAARGSLGAVVRGAVGCVVAFEVLGVTQLFRVLPPITRDGGPRTSDATTVLVVWVLLLGLVLLAVVRVTGRHTGLRPAAVGIAAGCGFAAAAVWLGLAAVAPWVAASNVPAVLAMLATGVIAARLIERGRSQPSGDGRTTSTAAVIGAVVAAMVTAAVVAAAIDGLLPLGHGWVRNSAPPWEHGTRLVDPVGLLVIAAALALVVAIAGRTKATVTKQSPAGA